MFCHPFCLRGKLVRQESRHADSIEVYHAFAANLRVHAELDVSARSVIAPANHVFLIRALKHLDAVEVDPELAV